MSLEGLPLTININNASTAFKFFRKRVDALSCPKENNRNRHNIEITAYIAEIFRYCFKSVLLILIIWVKKT
ncbi:hypothetical protein HMPREF2976_10430 [Corynebacterium sp. HMSC077D10]|nr:hypothetical protein HMPREF2998_03630 [Corynebacterium sp. HMSC065A05]OFP67568.1 hypothetical protein HMPREF2976_10430 [Corynebacterium sp. HMSC077D10]